MASGWCSEGVHVASGPNDCGLVTSTTDCGQRCTRTKLGFRGPARRIGRRQLHNYSSGVSTASALLDRAPARTACSASAARRPVSDGGSPANSRPSSFSACRSFMTRTGSAPRTPIASSLAHATPSTTATSSMASRTARVPGRHPRSRRSRRPPVRLRRTLWRAGAGSTEHKCVTECGWALRANNNPHIFSSLQRHT